MRDARAIVIELKKFSPELVKRERWLVLNKIDLLPAADRQRHCAAIVKSLRWKGSVFQISGLSGVGTRELCQKIMQRLESIQKESAPDKKNTQVK